MQIKIIFAAGIVFLLAFTLACSNGTTDTDDSSSIDGVITASSPGLDCIGCGYDVMGEYANTKGVKLKILDVDSLLADKKIYKRKIENSTCSSCSGSTFSEYSSAFNTKNSISGNYSYYSGSIKVNFSQSSLSSSSYSYVTVYTDIDKSRLYLSDMADIDDLRNYVDSGFDKYLNPQNDEEDNTDHLFENYGTSVLTDIYLGARMEYNTSAKKTSTSGSSSIDIDAYAKAEFKTLFSSSSISVSTTTDDLSSFTKNYGSISTIIHVLGGASEYITSLDSNTSSDPTDTAYSSWIASVADNVVFCGIGSNGVLPIYELAKTDARRNYLKTKYEEYVAANSITVTDTADTSVYTCIVDVFVISGTTANTVQKDSRQYYCINQNLNEGAGGGDVRIYVCYGKSDGSTYKDFAPITNFAIAYDSHSSSGAYGDVASTYTCCSNTDLNYKAGGDYMYLCYERSSTGTPITGIYVCNFTDKDKYYPYSYNTAKIKELTYSNVPRMWKGMSCESSEINLNRNAGGDYIYLYQTTGKWD
jgi:hypothetical protein